MKKTKLLLLLLMTGLLIQCSQKKGNIEKIKNGVLINAENLNVRIQFYGENMVRIIKYPKNGSSFKKSLSVIFDSIPTLNIETSEKENEIFISSSSLKLKISKNNGKIEFLNNKDENILKENGMTSFKPVVYDKDSSYSIQQEFELSPEEGIYGLGQHQDGYFNYRGKTVELVQSNTEAVNPFLVSTQNFGILWDNYSQTIFKDSARSTSIWSDVGDNIDYYFVYGKNMDQVISGYRTLTGKAPMYGKWAYGYWQSKEHCDTRDELMSVAKKYRKLKYPIDNMIQDWDYWNGHKNWSGMFFDPKLFPRPKEMVDELHKMNFHFIISIWPALGPNTDIYKEMAKNGYLFKPTGWAGFKYYDAYNPAANLLYWKYLRSGLYSKGLDGWWIDSTEPDLINALTKSATNYEMKKLGRNHLGSFARYLNPFSLVMTDDIYKFWRKETSDKRAYILTRSTFAGQQRNAATTWSGDIGASWEIYKNQISAGVNHSMSGIPYWTFDIGGFLLGSYEGVFIHGGKDPAYQELYARMFQLGAFTPIFRSHGSETPREMWEFGEFTKPIVKFDNLRYRLMPYIYSLAWKVTNEDYTIMRGLPMDFSYDKNTYSVADQFMFGPAMMVCPVTEYMYHKPPVKSKLIDTEFFRTNNGTSGLEAEYCSDPSHKNITKKQIDKNINIDWYGGRPSFVTDSSFSIKWTGKLIPKETGKHQFNLKSFDKKRIRLNGKELSVVYKSAEQYTEIVDLVAGKEYDFTVEVENDKAGAARMKLFWKTPSDFAIELTVEPREKTRKVYLPGKQAWIDFWTGATLKGGETIKSDAPIDKIPLMVKAGSIIPMGPFIQYTTEKPADPLELRIYKGADGKFTLYEDENDNYNYEKGIYSTIDFSWSESAKKLTIGKRKGEYPGMIKERKIQIILVSNDHGAGLEITLKPDKEINYNGEEIVIQF
jgi:alpha-D-xyloside xylohydrolase